MMRFPCALLLTCLFSFSSQAGTLAQFRTPLGDIEVELFDQDKPVTVQNFLRYVRSGSYSDMFMHRWVPGFVVQGGGFFVEDRHSTNASLNAISTFGQITNEFSVGRTFSNTYGTIAMARASGQANSATSQWFFNLADNQGLDGVDGGFTVFGRVVSGTNVLNRFNNTSSSNGIYRIRLDPPLNELPVLSSNPKISDLVYVDISLLQVKIEKNALGGRDISWNSVPNRTQVVEFTTVMPPQWQTLATVTGTGSTMRVSDPTPGTGFRFYRVRVDF